MDRHKAFTPKKEVIQATKMGFRKILDIKKHEQNKIKIKIPTPLNSSIQ